MLSLLFALAVSLDPPILTVDSGRPILFSREALLARPEIRTIHVVSSEFGGAVDVPAIPLADLLGGLAPGPGSIQVTCGDGFVAELPRASAAQRDPHKPIAYLAIDPLDGSWAPDNTKGYPGPYAVVWSLPPGQTVPREQWPNRVFRIAVGGSIAERFPALVPKGGAQEERGFHRFAESCMPCHTLNGQGSASIGPDLNQPQSPIDYFGKARLTAFIRDPQSLHRWSGARMPAFVPAVLSNADLADLIAYLAERAAHRPSAPVAR